MATEEEVSENDESLIALTTHFAQVHPGYSLKLPWRAFMATMSIHCTHVVLKLMCYKFYYTVQVQFRLKQIISADAEHKEVSRWHR